MSRIDKLMERMTLAEKLGQLTMTAASYAVTGPVIAGDSTESIRDGTIGNLLNMVGAGPVHEMQRLAVEESRLGIPLLIGLDVIHGHRTLFPIPLAEAGDVRSAALGAHGARGRARDGGGRARDDVRADARCLARSALGPHGRRAGRRPLARRADRAREGARLPGRRSGVGRIAWRRCAKHFCAYGPVNAGREYASVDISERTLREVHLPAFAAAVRGGAASIMPAFTDLDGIPMTAHIRAAARLSARRAGFRRRARERLQRDRRAHPARRRGRPRRGRGARAEGRRGHRHDGGRLSQRPAGRARARARDDGRDRRVRAPGAAPQGTARTVRRSVSARRPSARRPMCSPRAGSWRARSARDRS